MTAAADCATKCAVPVSMTRSSRNGTPTAIASRTAVSCTCLVPTAPDSTTFPFCHVAAMG